MADWKETPKENPESKSDDSNADRTADEQQVVEASAETPEDASKSKVDVNPAFIQKPPSLREADDDETRKRIMEAVEKERQQLDAFQEEDLAKIEAEKEERQSVGKSETSTQLPDTEQQNAEYQYPPLSNEVKDEIYRIQSLPVDERGQAVADFMASFENFLGNQSKEREILNLNMENGMDGATFHDADGNKYFISYKDQE